MKHAVTLAGRVVQFVGRRALEPHASPQKAQDPPPRHFLRCGPFSICYPLCYLSVRIKHKIQKEGRLSCSPKQQKRSMHWHWNGTFKDTFKKYVHIMAIAGQWTVTNRYASALNNTWFHVSWVEAKKKRQSKINKDGRPYKDPYVTKEQHGLNEVTWTWTEWLRIWVQGRSLLLWPLVYSIKNYK